MAPLLSGGHPLSSAQSQKALSDWLDANSSEAASAYGAAFQDPAQTALYADEVNILTEKMKKIVAELASEWRRVMGAHTLETLRFMDHELAVKQGRLEFHIWPKPPELPLPPPYNPPEVHIPPWLSEEAKALHVARALAAKGGPPTPTLAQQELDKARAEKRARKQADREASAKVHSQKPE